MEIIMESFPGNSGGYQHFFHPQPLFIQTNSPHISTPILISVSTIALLPYYWWHHLELIHGGDGFANAGDTLHNFHNLHTFWKDWEDTRADWFR